MYASESGDYRTVDFLLSKNLNPDVTDKVTFLVLWNLFQYGRTALIFACKNDHILTVETILQYTVNVLWKDYVGKKAKDYTTNKTIHNLLRHYMIEKNTLSDSLLKGYILIQILI